MSPAEPKSENISVPNTGAAIAPTAPVTAAAPAAITQPTAATLPKDNQAPGPKAGTKKHRSKPKPDDWITSIFGQ